jgi:hypothetical protein
MPMLSVLMYSEEEHIHGIIQVYLPNTAVRQIHQPLEQSKIQMLKVRGASPYMYMNFSTVNEILSLKPFSFPTWDSTVLSYTLTLLSQNLAQSAPPITKSGKQLWTVGDCKTICTWPFYVVAESPHFKSFESLTWYSWHTIFSKLCIG